MKIKSRSSSVWMEMERGRQGAEPQPVETQTPRMGEAGLFFFLSGTCFVFFFF